MKVRVFVLSDVAPFGPEVVGSGPFRGEPHVLLASNRDWVMAAETEARRSREAILEARHSLLGTEKHWADALSRKIRRQLTRKKSGLFIWGGEPQVRLPQDSVKRRGGRQSQIAGRLLDVFWDEIRDGRVEILCASSDGSDGKSGAAAIHLRRSIPIRSASLQRQLKKAIARFDTAAILEKFAVTIPTFHTGTNLQDLVLIRVSPYPAARPSKSR